MMNKKFLINCQAVGSWTSLFLFSIFILLSLLSCKKEENVLWIGVAGPMTGDQAKMGIDMSNGVTLAVEEWNERGGILGKKIKIIKGDDRRDPREAVNVANKFVNEGVVGVIGHFNSSCSIPASKIYFEFGIPQISPASTNPTLTEQGFDSVFRVCGRDDQQGKVGAEFILNILKKTKIAVLHDKTTYGQGLADELKKNAEALGATTVAYEGIIQGDNDFTAVLTKVKTKNPEVVYFGGIYPEAGLLVKQMRHLDLDAIFVSGDGVIDPEFIKIGGDATEGTFLSFGPSVEELPTAKKFIETYTERFGEIGPYSTYSYDATQILLTAISLAKTIDGKKVAEAIHNLRYEGALGAIEFDEKGDVKIAPYIFWVVKGGKFEPYKPAEPEPST
ncbi:branched-chain amino acid ABC transporter substrate-binding protein [candidate division TA06 bacterium]|nr:branched-chain amino acid ABC transporter substrate-binding protein [candidate division TA06 bacterium]